MSEHSTIEWIDASWPVTTGCDDPSPGCLNCDRKRDSRRLAVNPNPTVATADAGTTVRVAPGVTVRTPYGGTVAGPTPPGPGAPRASELFALDIPTGLARRSFPPRGLEPGLDVSY